MRSASSSPYDAIAELSKWVAESALSLDEIWARAQEDLIRQQFGLVSAFFEGVLHQLQAAAEARTPQEFCSLQIDAATRGSDKVLAGVHEAVDIHSQVREEFRDWLRDAFKLFPSGPSPRLGIWQAA